MRIAIIGTGYVGLASAIGFAELGHTVIGYDILPDRIAQLQAGVAPYHEAGFEGSIGRLSAAGRISFTTDFETAVRGARAVVIAVGTPSRDDGSADLQGVFATVDALRRCEGPRPIVVIRSTVPPGTSDRAADLLADRADVIVAPEFLREGSAVHDFLHPDRVVIGADPYTAGAAREFAALFEPLGTQVVMTTRKDAELVKGVSNAFLALKISFANQVANLCDALDADARSVLFGVGLDRRIGTAFLGAGIGFGGPCFEKDCKSLVSVGEQAGSRMDLVAETLAVNRRQQHRVLEILAESELSLRGLTVGVWGLAFKGGTDDVRDSVAMRIVEDLCARGAAVRAFDPLGKSAQLPAGAQFAQSALDAADADVLLVLTDWQEFAEIEPLAYATRVRAGLVIDGRNILDVDRVAKSGLEYRGIGRRRLTTTEALRRVS